MPVIGSSIQNIHQMIIQFDPTSNKITSLQTAMTGVDSNGWTLPMSETIKISALSAGEQAAILGVASSAITRISNVNGIQTVTTPVIG